eukprot:4387384-Alexandrium_andersonii.AAC.1
MPRGLSDPAATAAARGPLPFPMLVRAAIGAMGPLPVAIPDGRLLAFRFLFHTACVFASEAYT